METAGKATALAVWIIAMIVVWHFLVSHFETKCADQAIEIGGDELLTILDSRWTVGGCQYLVSWNYTKGVSWHNEGTLTSIRGSGKDQL